MAISNLTYKSFISTRNISKSVSNLRDGIFKTQENAINMNSILSNSNKRKKNEISRNIINFSKKIERLKRKEKEDIVEASFLSRGIVKTGNAITNITSSAKGFLGRILDSVGIIIIGWMVNNLPTIINLAKELGERIQKFVKIMSFAISGVSDIMSGFGGVLSGIYSSIISFDFTDSENKVSDSMDKLLGGFGKLEISIFNFVNLFTGDLNKIFGFEIPKIDVPQIPGVEGGGIPIPSTPPVSGGNSDFWTLVAIVSREDGDPQGQADVAQSIYNRAASGAYGSSSIRELILRTKQYQPTWERPNRGKEGKPNPEWFAIKDAESAAKASGFSVATIKGVAQNIKNPTLQKNAAEFVGGRTDFKGANSRFPGGIQRKPGDNYFGWQYGYKGTSVAPVPQLGATLSQSQSPTQTPPPTQIRKLRGGEKLTSKIGKGVEYVEITDAYGARGGTHRGIDIAAPAGTYIALRVDCQVVGTKVTREGYGKVIDVWVPQYKVQLRFAHCQSFIITSGKIPAGTSFARVGSTGKSTGPHIHFEYSTKYNDTTYGGSGDPSAYVGLILLTNKKSTASSTVPQVGKPAPAQINIESVGRDVATLQREKSSNIITVPLPQQPQVATIPLMMNNDPPFTPSEDNVNMFIIKKLLLDLAYT